MTAQYRNGLFWFRHDLRLSDNAAFSEVAAKSANLTCIYIVDPRWFKNSHFQSRHMGDYRWQFLQESLFDLHTHLSEFGQKLYVLEGNALDIIRALVSELDIDVMGASFHAGVYERQQWQRLKLEHTRCHFVQQHSHTLFAPSDLPFELSELPASFTPFRKKVEPVQIPEVQGTAASLPSPINIINTRPALTAWQDVLTEPDALIRPGEAAKFIGGSQAGNAQLHYFLNESHAVSTYKQTRNQLDGWEYSSKLSAWLANGSLSARQAYRALKAYESKHSANESTYWLYFELLWREYFQWYLVNHQSALFKFAGVQNKKPLTTFNPQRFAIWCQGNTPYPIVNACMKQLNATGYMSNRGRQLVASCLVHELEMDWRYGAAYFEQKLIDFDVASNWGNWQYLAGVGADPRGHRRFDLDKQTQQYDPEQAFIDTWKGKESVSPLESVDAADWPLSE